MKRILAVALLLLSFATAALADGPFLPPGTTGNPPKLIVAPPADGPFLPPTTGEPTKP